MSVAISTLTSSDAVRSALGLESNDLPDTFFTAHDLGPELEIELSKWFATWADHMGADPLEPLIEAALKAYAKYWVAWLVATAHATYALASLSDGQNEISRQSDHGAKELRATLLRLWSRYRAYLIAQLPEEALDNAPARTLFSGVSPAFDPVTNETT